MEDVTTGLDGPIAVAIMQSVCLKILLKEKHKWDALCLRDENIINGADNKILLLSTQKF